MYKHRTAESMRLYKILIIYNHSKKILFLFMFNSTIMSSRLFTAVMNYCDDIKLCYMRLKINPTVKNTK